MSYDIYLNDPETGAPYAMHHDFRGGTYALGGSPEAWLNITYNYSQFYRDTIDEKEGIRWIYGRTGAEVLPVLKAAVKQLGTATAADYWEATARNAGKALLGLIAFAEAYPEGIFSGD